MATELQRVKLKPGRAKPLWYGHPWVYSEAVERADQITPGDEVQIVDHDGRFIGRGFANPRSQIFVRIAERADRPLDEGWLRSRLHAARSLRARLRLPSAETDAYRLVNSEGDGLPGLIVDVFGDSAVVQLTTMGMKRREAEIFAAVTELLRPRTLYEASSGGAAQKVEGFVAQARVVAGESRPEVPCRENGAALVVEPLVGQKTGWFLDQRENRAFVAGLARGARVLDLYTYAGGFALAAALGGAAKITAVDVSPRALERAGKNFALNGIDPPELVEADVFRYLEAAPAGAFDLVICDPPKFARARKDLDAALRGYRHLNALALAACADDAMLATASCSQLVDDESFERMLAGAAKDAHRTLQVVHVAYQAGDHTVPVAFPEGRYLKMFVCRVT